MKGLYLLGSNDTAPTENHYIDTTAFRTNALGGSYDFDMPNQHVTVHAVFQQTASGESYPITTEVIGYPGARLYAYTGAYPYDAELNDAGAVTEAALYSTVDVMLDASTSDISINKLPLDYELVGLYLNPTDYPESHYIDSEAFVSNYMSWGEGQIYGGSWYRFMVLGPTHVVAVVAPTGGSVEFPQHAVIYNADGGSGEMPADTAAQGASFALPECGFTPPAGRQFKAWLINDVEYAPGDGVRFTEDTEVVAVWEDIPVAVTGLAITTQPRLSYTEGEALDLAALAVTATYSDGSTESLDYGDVTCSPAHGTQLTAAHNGQTITVTFGGKTARTNALVVSAATTGGDLAPHTHSLAYKYSDGAGHWQECSDANCPDVAGSKTATASHSYDNDTDTTCVCGYTRTIMPSHTHSLAYKYSDTEHWQECSITNCPDVAGSKTGTAAHSYDNDTDTTCVCGYTRTIDSGSTGGPGGGYTPPSDSDDDDDSGNDTPTVPDDEDDTPAVPPVPPVTVPVSGDENSIQVGAVVSGTTATIGTIDLSALGTVIGSHVGTGVVTIDLSGLNKAIDTVKLPTSAVKQITDAANDPNNDAESLEIIFTNGTSIEFDAKALGEKSAQAGGDDIAISIKSAKGSALNTRQQQTIGSRPAWGINITSGGNPISDIGGEMKIQTPYTLLPGEKAEGIVVFYVDDNGNKERCETNFNSAANIVSWTTSHNSVYMIGYEEPQVNPDTGGDTSEEIPASPETGDDTPAYVTYTVQRGDTLWAIANKYGCTVSGIVAANSGLIKDPNLIYAGWQLKIPQAGATGSAPDAILPDDKKTSVYIVKQGDTLWAISKMYGCTVAEIVALNGELITDPNLIFAGWELKIPQD